MSHALASMAGRRVRSMTPVTHGLRFDGSASAAGVGRLVHVSLPQRRRLDGAATRWFARKPRLPSLRAPWRVVATLAVLFFVVVSEAVMRLRLGGSRVAVDFDDLAEWAAAWLASGSCLWASRRGVAGGRRFWALVGASAFAWGAGQAVWSYYEVGLGVRVPFPSADDVGYLSAVPLMVAALLSFPVAPLRPFARAVMLLDGALVAGSTVFVSWALVLGPIYRARQGDVFAQTVLLAYPAGDVLIVVVVVSVAARASRSGWVALAFVTAGVLSLAFSDSAFAYLSQSGTYGSGLSVDIGWIAGFGLIALAPLWARGAPARIMPVERSSRVGVFVPYVPVAGALAVAVGYVVSGRDLGPFLLATGVVTVIVLVGRQLAALLDSVALDNKHTARFTALVQRSSDLTTIVAPDGTIVYQSPSSLSLLGWSDEWLTGRNFRELVHPDDAPAFLRSLAQVSKRPAGETVGEWRLAHHDGHYLEAESRLANLLDDASVCGVTINSRDISERKQLEDELRVQSVHDSLTGLPNRTLLNDRLDRALALQKRDRDHHDLALLLIDLDDFTGVNDSLGHTAGDELLRDVARRLEQAVRSADTVARTGGDEFAVMLDSTLSTADINDTADRILAVFKQPFQLAGNEYYSRASVGIAVASTDTVDAATLLQEAGIAMHAAKLSGKGSRETYTPGMRELVIDRRQLAADMRHAIARDELVVVYQPIVDLASKTVNGVEALMRWQHPTRGLLDPDCFIPAAESSGLIVPMGRWLLREACSDLRSWDDLSDGPPLRLNVNLSARQLDDAALVAEVAAALSEFELDPSRLTLEITETVLLRDVDSVMATLTELKRLGVELSIDDFGTGYSSLSYLRQLPVDEIKIDRSFITPMTGSKDAARLVETIMRLADDLGLRTVAEGIETHQQLEQLDGTPCELVQGYLFDPPLTRGQFRTRMQERPLPWPTAATQQTATAPQETQPRLARPARAATALVRATPNRPDGARR